MSTMDIELAARLLKIAGICETLTDEEAERIAAAGAVREAAAGEVLIQEGDSTSELLVILEGRAEVFKHDPKRGEDLKLGEIQTGDSVGELAMLRTDQRSATVKAAEPCQLFVLDRPAFDRLVGAAEPAAYKIALQLARIVADRMKGMHDRVLEYFLSDQQPQAQEFATFKRDLMVKWDF